MFSATTKFIASSLLLLAVTACSGGADNSANELYEQANRLYESGDAAAAIVLLDSIDRAYPSQTDVRRNGMHLRAMAIEKLTVDRLAATDSLIAVLTLENEKLAAQLTRVSNAVEPYIIANGTSLPPTGIQARLSPDGVAYLVSSLSGHAVHHTSVTATSASGSASTTPVPNDGERSVWSGSDELVHFVGAECDSILRFIASTNDRVTITWNGKTTYSRPLTVNEQAGIAVIGRYADTATRLKVAAYEHDRLEKQLEIARSQAARTFVDGKDDEKSK